MLVAALGDRGFPPVDRAIRAKVEEGEVVNVGKLEVTRWSSPAYLNEKRPRGRPPTWRASSRFKDGPQLLRRLPPGLQPEPQFLSNVVHGSDDHRRDRASATKPCRAESEYGLPVQQHPDGNRKPIPRQRLVGPVRVRSAARPLAIFELPEEVSSNRPLGCCTSRVGTRRIGHRQTRPVVNRGRPLRRRNPALLFVTRLRGTSEATGEARLRPPARFGFDQQHPDRQLRLFDRGEGGEPGVLRCSGRRLLFTFDFLPTGFFALLHLLRFRRPWPSFGRCRFLPATLARRAIAANRAGGQ